ncbi:hypothetical protein DDI_0587 [Dickeya dianthicola RNS04.9]|nr:hypothetical protein DDI_0587 [Dickeya dianthicola RNS04.9]
MTPESLSGYFRDKHHNIPECFSPVRHLIIAKTERIAWQRPRVR